MKAHTIVKKIAMLIVVALPLLATAFAIRMLWERAVTWSDIALLFATYSCTALGITVGYHRMLTHRSFRPQPIIKFILLAFGSMGVEGPALEWASTHIKHHALADREGDPHSPLDGFLHAHLGWMFHERDADPNIYCRNLVNDAMVNFFTRTFLLWVALSLLIPYLVGGWKGLLWGGLVRIFLLHHVTWSVNSVCHSFGKREFETPDVSRNEWLVGLLSFGEGWHNNHHAFPRSAFHGLHWWQVDCSGYIITLLERFGLVHDVYRVSPQQLARRSMRDTTLPSAMVPIPTAGEAEKEMALP